MGSATPTFSMSVHVGAHTPWRGKTQRLPPQLCSWKADCPLKAGISLCTSKAPSAVTPQHFSRSVTDPLSAILATRTKLGWFFCCFVSNKDQISGAILEKVWHSPAKKKKRCVVERLLCVLNVCWQPARMLLPQQRPDAREGESSSEQLQLLIAE